MKLASLFSALLALISTTIFSQQLPVTQQTNAFPSMMDGIIVSGKNQLQQYNRSIEAFYNVTYDNDNLYLFVRAEKDRIIYKIIEGGISFTVSGSGKKKDKNNAVVVFPLMRVANAWATLHIAGKSIIENPHKMSDNSNSAIDAKKISFSEANNKLKEFLKEIKVTGMPAVIDTIAGVKPKSKYYNELPLREHNFKIIPIINHDGIIPVVQFDEKGACVYKLTIPLKLLGIHIGQTQKFIYNIRINGRFEDVRIGGSWVYKAGGADVNQDLDNATDFWGEYILTKKP